MDEDVGGRRAGQVARTQHRRTSSLARLTSAPIDPHRADTVRSRFKTTWCVLACVPLALLGCGNGPRSTAPPNVLLIVVDTLRADRLGSYGSQRGLTPFLDQLAAKGFVFTHAYAASSWTRPSVASLFTSRYPSQHGAVTVLHKIGGDELTVAEVFQRLGYVTGAVSGSPIISKISGFAQGFDYFREFPWREKIRVGRVKKELLTWLGRVWPSSQKPVFLYLHLMEPHGPYYPPEPHRGRFRRGEEPAATDFDVNRKVMRAWHKFMKSGELQGFRQFTAAEIELMASLYDGEVASLDAELRALFEELERRKFLDRAIVIVTADHGEEFYEHGGTWHGYTLYNEVIRVPLLIVVPGSSQARGQARRQARRMEENVSLVDVPPTLLDLLEAPSPPVFEGRSFASRMESPSSLRGRLAGLWAMWSDGGAPSDTLSELEESGGHPSALPKHSRALIHRSLKVLTQPGGGSEAYDLARDPGEQSPNPAALAQSSAQLIDALQRRHTELVTRARAKSESFELDAATKDRLRALGYPVD